MLGKLVGIITDRDICISTFTRGQAPQQIPVADAMTQQVYSCAPNEPVSAAERLMSDYQIRRVPVVDDADQPIGLLSFNDIARHVARSGASNGEKLAAIQTMSGICKSHRSSLAEIRA